MGLSNKERYSKIVWSIKNIEELLGHIKGYRTNNITQYKGKLWPAFLNGEANAGYWIFGGGFDCEFFKEESLLCEALSVHKPEENLFPRDSENYIQENLNLSRILGGRSSRFGAVVEIYRWIENFYYAVNRYDDEFSNSILELKSVISNLRGDIFVEISENADYFRGFLLFNILQKCIDQYNDDCPLTKMIVRHHFFHHFRLREDYKAEDLFETWKEIQFSHTKDIPLQKRIFLTLCCFGRKIGEEYSAKMVKESIGEFVNETLLDEVLTYCAKQEKEFVEKAKGFGDQFNFCYLTSDY